MGKRPCYFDTLSPSGTMGTKRTGSSFQDGVSTTVEVTNSVEPF